MLVVVVRTVTVIMEAGGCGLVRLVVITVVVMVDTNPRPEETGSARHAHEEHTHHRRKRCDGTDHRREDTTQTAPCKRRLKRLRTRPGSARGSRESIALCANYWRWR